jgi:hypothetical protein
MRLSHLVSSLAVTLALLLPSAAAAQDAPLHKTIKTPLSPAYTAGQSFRWNVAFNSRTVVKEGVQVKMDIKVKQELTMTATVREVDKGLPTRLRVVVDTHTATVSKASPIKPRADLAGHWFEATIAPQGKQQLLVGSKDADFPKGKDALDTLSNLVFLPAPLPAEPVDSSSRWSAPKGFLGGIYTNLITTDSSVDVALISLAKNRSGHAQATLSLTCKGEDKSNENGFVAIATGDLKRRAEFSLATGLFTGYEEETVLAADAQSNDGRSFHSTVTLTAKSTLTLQPTAPEASTGGKGEGP